MMRCKPRSSFEERAKQYYTDCGLSIYEKGFYLQDANTDNIWNDINMNASDFGDKYLKILMDEMRQNEKIVYKEVISTIDAFLETYRELQEEIRNMENRKIKDVVHKLLNVDWYIGIDKHHKALLEYLLAPKTSQLNKKLIPRKSFISILKSLPFLLGLWNGSSGSEEEYNRNVKYFEPLLCKFVYIYVKWVVDCIRFIIPKNSVRTPVNDANYTDGGCKKNVYKKCENDDNIWGDINMSGSDFGDKYLGELMDNLRKNEISVYTDVINTINRFLTDYADLQYKINQLEIWTIKDIVPKILNIDWYIGIGIVNKVKLANLITRKNWKLDVRFLSKQFFEEIKTSLPFLRERWCLAENDSKEQYRNVTYFEPLLCKLVYIYVKFAVDCLRILFPNEFILGKNVIIDRELEENNNYSGAPIPEKEKPIRSARRRNRRRRN